MTLQEVKDQTAKEHGYKGYKELVDSPNIPPEALEWYHNRVAELYARNLILEFSHTIQRDINLKVIELRDHAAHSIFCNSLNEIRNKVLDNTEFRRP